MLTPSVPAVTFRCDVPHDLRLLRTAEAITDRYPLRITQHPPVLMPNQPGALTLEIVMAGDVETVKFECADETVAGEITVETWPRTGCGSENGRVLSFFSQSWPHTVLEDYYSRNSVFDAEPSIFWGDNVIEPGGSLPTSNHETLYFSVYLNASTTEISSTLRQQRAASGRGGLSELTVRFKHPVEPRAGAHLG